MAENAQTAMVSSRPMRRLIVLTCLIGSVSLCSESSWALEFTADQVTKVNGRVQKANVYYRDAMWRIEHQVMGPVNISIVRKDKQLVWMLLSRLKRFKTIPYHSDYELRIKKTLEGEVSRQEIGTEVREGHPTILYEVTTKQGELITDYYQWVATDTQFPMKLAKKDGSWILEYQNVKMRSVSDYLFNLPVNFHPLEEFDHQQSDQPSPGLSFNKEDVPCES